MFKSSFRQLTLIYAVFLHCFSFATSLDRPNRFAEFIEVTQALSADHGFVEIEDKSLTQDLIDWTIAKLLSTPFGSSLASKLLENCDAGLINLHLGSSLKNPYANFADYCQRKQTSLSNSWLMVELGTNISAVKSSIGKRTFEIVLYSQSHESTLRYDSWTDLRNKKTTIFLDSRLNPEEVLRQLARTVAHETAIYFDSKANITSKRVDLFQSLSSFQLASNQSLKSNPHLRHQFITASQNPFIQYTTSFIRAFRVERFWVGQLQTEVFGEELGAVYQNHEVYPFLQNCDHNCLWTVIKDTAEESAPDILALLTASHYGKNKRRQLTANGIQSSKQEALKDALRMPFKELYPQLSIEKVMGIQPEMNLDPRLQHWRMTLRDIFIDDLNEEDRQVLLYLSIHSDAGQMSSALEWLMLPKLSNTGIAWAYGARPRLVSSHEGDSSTSSSSSLSTSIDFSEQLIEMPTLEEATHQTGRGFDLGTGD